MSLGSGAAAGRRRKLQSSERTAWTAATLDLAATVALGRWLAEQRYDFTTVTPETHRRVLAGGAAEARDLRDIFGWSRPFRGSIFPALAERLEHCGALERVGELLRSRIRFSALAGHLFVHTAYPTTAADAVFFGPDTYRFGALIRSTLAAMTTPVRRIIDIGAGSGAGGLLAASLFDPMPALALTDLSAAALRCAAINAALAGIDATCVSSDVLAAVVGDADLILCNPPYLADPDARLYRHGGSAYGSELSLRIVREALPRLRPGGRLVLYTGSAVVDGVDVFRHAVTPLLREAGAAFEYRELDPDVFGEELDQPGYAGVERIAVIGLIVQAPRRTEATR